jgi:hypothetical protein
MLSASVNTLLQRYGSDLTLVRQVGGTYNPATGTLSGGTPTNYTVRGVFINYRDENVDGSVIRMGDRRLLVSPQGSTTVPAIGDVVGGMKLVDVRSYAPNDVAIAWACQARR